MVGTEVEVPEVAAEADHPADGTSPNSKTTYLKILKCHNSPWEPPCSLEELDLLGFMIDSGLKLSHEHHEPHWQNCSLEHFALISAN